MAIFLFFFFFLYFCNSQIHRDLPALLKIYINIGYTNGNKVVSTLNLYC